jgi:hypothetical protein
VGNAVDIRLRKVGGEAVNRFNEESRISKSIDAIANAGQQILHISVDCTVA